MNVIFWKHWLFWQALFSNFWGTVSAAGATFAGVKIYGWLQILSGRRQSQAAAAAAARLSQSESRPILVLDYQIKGARQHPEEASHPIQLTNIGLATALNATVGAIAGGHLVVRFDPVPAIRPGETGTVSHHVEGGSPVFGDRLVSVLDAVHAELRPPSLAGVVAMIAIPVAVEYEDANGNRYITESEIQFSGFYQEAVAVFRRTVLRGTAAAPTNSGNPQILRSLNP